MTSFARGTLEMTGAMTISGTIGWFVIVSGVPVGQLVFWRCFFGAVVLGFACWMSGLSPRQLSRQQIWLCIGSGLALVANWLLLFGAFAHVGIAFATILYNSQPFILVILGRKFLGESLTRNKLGWLVMGFVGLIMVVATGLRAGGSDQKLGMAMAVGAACCWAAAAIQTKLLGDVPPRLTAFVHVSIGLVVLAPIGLRAPEASWPFGWAMLATIGAVHTGVVFILMYDAIRRLPTHVQGTLSYIYPAVAILVDIVAFGHRMGSIEAAGMLIILIAAGGTIRLWPGIFAALGRSSSKARA